MRKVQVSIQIQRFGVNAPNGQEQTIGVYADANNEYEALCAAFYEALDAIGATDGSLPSFGRRASSDKNFPSKKPYTGEDRHLCESVAEHTLAIGDITASHVARLTAPSNYIVFTDIFERGDNKANGGRVVAFADTKADAIQAAIAYRKENPVFIQILSNYKIPHDCRGYPEDMELEEVIADLENWANG